MPDLINPEHNNGLKEHIVWKDERCASCLNVGNCPLIQVMHDNTIMTLSGCHVFSCDGYKPDVESPYYVSPDAIDMDTIRNIDTETIQQSMDLLTRLMDEVSQNVLAE